MDVLLVEDDPRIARVVERALTDVGHRVEVAHDGLEGLTSAERGGHDLVVLDVMLPEMDGIEVARELRRQRLKTPILMLTARDAIPDRVRGLDAGADDYLCKPFAFAELLARVRALTRRRRPAGDLLSHADLTVDLTTHRVERAGKAVALTAREEALLVFFLRHPGEVLTRTVLYNNVWDEFYDGASNTLEVHVMELRRKLEAHGPRVIHTIRGRGYLYEATPPTESP